MSLPPFQRVLDDHGPAVHRYLVASVGHHDGADCYQETMLAALRHYPSVTDGGHLRAWLFTIAHSKVVDLARARDRRPVPVGAVPESSAVIVDEPVSPDGAWAAVRELPPRQRTAVVLRHLGGWGASDIADVIGCSEDAARQNVRAGLTRLREMVER